MKERPILFNTPMVQAILSGQKTQTRRIVNKAPTTEINHRLIALNNGWNWQVDQQGIVPTMHREIDNPMVCPYGQIGDRLWVRESWYQKGTVGRSYPDDDEYQFFGHKQAAYVADGDAPKDWTVKKRPSIHMPRWASRILLEITNIRVQRLQAISVEDALAEGIVHRTMNCPRHEYFQLWNQINGEMAHDKNPWVWVVEFKVIKGGAV